jgi:hypothetical protein
MTLDRRTIVIVAATALILLIGGGIAMTRGGGEEDAATTTSTTQKPAATTTTKPVPVCPLLGTPSPDKVDLNRPALVVKIDNVQPAARPQSGIRQADLVVEERVEGSVTRLMAVFHCSNAAPVGPVRSARSSDIAIYSALNRPLFAWSGANDNFTAKVKASNIIDVGHTPAVDQYYRGGGKAAPHNLFIRGVAEMLKAHAPVSAKPPPPFFNYRAKGARVDGGRPVRGVHITFGTSAGSAPVDYVWNGVGWARSQAGTPHLDASGQQVVPYNVVVQFTPYGDSGATDQLGHAIPEAQVIGHGTAWVLTGGRLIEARWDKATKVAVTTYTDANHHPVLLTPGTTWVALPQPGGASVL